MTGCPLGAWQIMAGYALDGTAMVDYATLSFIAPAWCLLRVRHP